LRSTRSVSAHRVQRDQSPCSSQRRVENVRPHDRLRGASAGGRCGIAAGPARAGSRCPSAAPAAVRPIGALRDGEVPIKYVFNSMIIFESCTQRLDELRSESQCGSQWLRSGQGRPVDHLPDPLRNAGCLAPFVGMTRQRRREQRLGVGMFWRAGQVRASPLSTILPRYMTAIVWLICATAARS
jgi:hypothetical protein